MIATMTMTVTTAAICESLMVIGNGRIGKIPKTGKTGHKLGEIYKIGGDIGVRRMEGTNRKRQRIIFRDTAHNLQS